MPGAVPRTSTISLNNATLPFVLQLANKGYVKAMRENMPLSLGLNTIEGKLTNLEVSLALGISYTEKSELMK